MGYTASTLYVVFLCQDSKPQTIRTHLARRENILNDDWVSVLIDPFQDHRRGVLFKLNPYGVQADALYTEGNDPDYSYDQVWDSDGQRLPKGWMVLFAIPFRSIRSSHTRSDWGVVLTRNLPRNSEHDSWPAVSDSISGVLPQEATLSGIEGVSAAHNFQINPYALAHNLHILDSRDPARPFFSNRKLAGTAGGDAKLIIRNSLVLDATINPDFSQVESDEPQFTVNQRFPVYFPELRPFFLENANYFSTPINLLYTRNIVRPEVGARLTGKIGHTNLGFLAADDRQPGYLVSPSDPAYHQRAKYVVGRISQDLGQASSLGVLYSDREFSGTWSRVGGIDFNLRLNDKWTATGQEVVSSTRYADGTYGAGPATYLEINRQGHSFFLDHTYKDYAANFTSQAGFIRVNNIRENENHVGYSVHPNHGLFQLYQAVLSNDFAWDHKANRLFHYTEADLSVAFPRNTVFTALGGENSDTLGPNNYSLLVRRVNLAQNYGGFAVRSSPIPQLNFKVFFTHGGNPNYNPAANQVPVILHENFMQARVTVQPFHALTLDNTYLLDANRTSTSSDLVFENQTFRTKINYQFTKAFSARAIVEYDSLLTNPLYTSLVRTKQVSTEVLFTWLPHPGTAVYLGYDSNLQNLDRALCNRVQRTGECDVNNPGIPRSMQYLNDGRQIFLKASYLLRF